MAEIRTIRLEIKCRHYHPVYGLMYSAGISGTQQMHSRFSRLFLTLDEVYALIADFRNERPIFISGESTFENVDRKFNYRYQINWDFASIDKALAQQ